MTKARQAFSDDRFFIVDLPFVADVLPVAATRGTQRVLSIGRRLEQLGHARYGVIFLFFDDARFDHVARSGPGDKNHAFLAARETRSAVHEFFDFETHKNSRIAQITRMTKAGRTG